MARCNLSRHWKFCRLARSMGSRPLARGTLEMLWEAAYEAVSDYIGNADDIAYAVDWTGEAAILVQWLVDAGFLDVTPRGYQIHDLWANVPKYVKLRWTRAHPGAPPPWRDEPGPSSSVPDPGTYPSHPIPAREEEQRAPRATPCGKPNVRVLVRLGYDLDVTTLDRDDADTKEALKTRAAQAGVPFDGTSINKALEILLHTRGAPLTVRSPRQPGLPMRQRLSR